MSSTMSAATATAFYLERLEHISSASTIYCTACIEQWIRSAAPHLCGYFPIQSALPMHINPSNPSMAAKDHVRCISYSISVVHRDMVNEDDGSRLSVRSVHALRTLIKASDSLSIAPNQSWRHSEASQMVKYLPLTCFVLHTYTSASQEQQFLRKLATWFKRKDCGSIISVSVRDATFLHSQIHLSYQKWNITAHQEI